MIKIDYCKICGVKKPLTLEHIPPKSAFNRYNGKLYTGEEVMLHLHTSRLPWDNDGLKYTQFQSGFKDYTLCKECNMFTGSKYGIEYVKFVDMLHNLFSQNTIQLNKQIILFFKNIHPLQIFKQIISQFCSITTISKEDSIRNFILHPEANGFPVHKYRVIANLFNEGLQRIVKPSVVCISEQVILYSEIIHYPIAYTLIMNFDEITKVDINDFGTDITFLSEYKYNEVVDLNLKITSQPQNTIIPFDFRDKETIEKMWK